MLASRLPRWPRAPPNGRPRGAAPAERPLPQPRPSGHLWVASSCLWHTVCVWGPGHRRTQVCAAANRLWPRYVCVCCASSGRRIERQRAAQPAPSLRPEAPGALGMRMHPKTFTTYHLRRRRIPRGPARARAPRPRPSAAAPERRRGGARARRAPPPGPACCALPKPSSARAVPARVRSPALPTCFSTAPLSRLSYTGYILALPRASGAARSRTARTAAAARTHTIPLLC